MRNINHIWFHRLPQDKQDKINKLFQEYKRLFMQEIPIELVDDLQKQVELTIAELEITEEGIKVGKKEKYNRAKTKAETRKLKDEYER